VAIEFLANKPPGLHFNDVIAIICDAVLYPKLPCQSIHVTVTAIKTSACLYIDETQNVFPAFRRQQIKETIISHGLVEACKSKGKSK
jgi:hypothetical protein